jgi:hypothetical protein
MTPTLVSKQFNSEGASAVFTISFTVTTALTLYSSIIVEFHYAYSSKLNRRGVVDCYLNTQQVYCAVDNRQVTI